MSTTNLLRKALFQVDAVTSTDSEIRAFVNIFRIHPLTTDAIKIEDTREKC
ncbi:hypothetical protein BDF19DRAFT_426285 [Syncephalis fuscata]|nr:hypothetical protein BDF19DRAFT_426285 [Syncephalis fuscata]